MAHETDFLNELVLFRNDPELVGKVEPYALGGNPHAQYALGLIYAEGRGVDVDLAASYAWLTLAVLQGDRDAQTLRNIVGVDLTDEEFTAGRSMAAQLEKTISVPLTRH